MSDAKTPTKFYNVGISYRKADVKVRGAFSISKENQIALLKDAKQRGLKGVFVLSTCNRTEITGFAKHPFILISLLLKYSNGTIEDFGKYSQVFKNKEAVEHLFKIGTGLESQILGDYEIVGQLKKSFKQAKKIGTTNAYLERLMNLVLQASKEVKNKTKLSSGTTSVSYAAIQYMISNLPNYKTANVLIYGLGEIGKNTCKNVLEYTGNTNITLVNRTFEKAQEFKKRYPNIRIESHENLEKEIEKSDVLIVSTGASRPPIGTAEVQNAGKLMILDLSMPENVVVEVKEQRGITLVNVDELSKITDATIEIRKQEIPKAGLIIQKFKGEFNEWIANRKYVPAVNALKESLKTIQNDELNFHAKKIDNFNAEHAEQVTNRMIQKITTQFVKHLKDDCTSVDQSIAVISKIFNTEIAELNE